MMVDETQVTSLEEQGEQMVGPLQRGPVGLEGGPALGTDYVRKRRKDSTPGRGLCTQKGEPALY